MKEPARSGDVVIVMIPEGRGLPRDLFAGVPENLVVVDTRNEYPQQRDGLIPEIEAGMAVCRWVERQLGRPVVRAFNNVYDKDLKDRGCPASAPGRIALPVAGDNSESGCDAAD